MWLSLNTTQRQIFAMGMTYTIGILCGLALWATEVEKIMTLLRSVVWRNHYRFSFYYLKTSYSFFIVVPGMESNPKVAFKDDSPYLPVNMKRCPSPDCTGFYVTVYLTWGRASCWALSNYMSPEKPTAFSESRSLRDWKDEKDGICGQWTKDNAKEEKKCDISSQETKE